MSAAQLFVAEGTFGVLDGGDIPVDTADWSNGLAAPMSHGALILTGIRTGDVQVAAEPRDTPPQEGDHTTWEEIVETSIQCQSGQLLVESLDLGPSDELPNLATAGPGWYRLRVHAHGRTTNPRAPTPTPSSATCSPPGPHPPPPRPSSQAVNASQPNSPDTPTSPHTAPSPPHRQTNP